ncbi:hypothetical protein H5410_035698 [Solanum commersonii]|uniref:Uncharacterized protein n=1 Tax=Solanum commersonii TaxID=4109 RepID=A0A9J5Y3C9_SOLCO|nr:hypothetical protein H5410_035698 [Solanum commersonii]
MFQVSWFFNSSFGEIDDESQIVLGGMSETEAHLWSLVIKNYHLNVKCWPVKNSDVLKMKVVEMRMLR